MQSMGTLHRGRTASVGLALGLGITLSAAMPAEAQVIRSLTGTGTLAANDDSSTGLVPLGFTGNFFGTSISSAFVNNNGNITFDSSLSTFTPFPLSTTNRQIIAPFFADVDTRGSGSGLVNYGQVSVAGRPGFVVNWPAVGYYSARTDKLNTFQLVLIDRSDTGAGNFDIEFNYGRIQWETGEASDGVDGLGGSSARAGWANGSGATFELPGSAVNGALIDGGVQALINSSNISTPGRWLFRVRNGQIIVDVAPMPFGRAMDAMATRLANTIHRDLLFRLSGNNGGLDGQSGGAELPAFTSLGGEHPMVAILREESGGGAGGTLDALTQFATALQALTGGDALLFQSGGLRGFLVGSYDWGRVDGRPSLGQSRTEYDGPSFAIGVDYQVDPSLLIGAALHYGQLTGKLTGPTGRVEMNSFGASAFASWAPMQNAYLDGVFGVSFLDTDTRRQEFAGTARGSTTGTQIAATLQGGYNFEAEGLRFGPVARLHYSRTEFGAFSENGPGAVRVGSIDAESLTARLGLRATYPIDMGDFVLLPTGMVGYEHEFSGGGNRIAISDLLGGTSGTTNTGDRGADYMVTEVGIAARMRTMPAIFSVSYFGEQFRADGHAHALTARSRLQF